MFVAKIMASLMQNEIEFKFWHFNTDNQKVVHCGLRTNKYTNYII